MQVHLTLKSANVKTGPIPVSTTERDSCPADCQMKAECYAASGPLALHWAAVSMKTRGTSWGEFCETIARLPDNQIWRHNQAGDLPQQNGTIDAVKLGQLVAANKNKRGFTYSHHRDADYLANQNAGPVVVVLPSTQNENLKTPGGRPVVMCPATQRDDVSCATCQLCQRQRSTIVGFPAHGSRHRTINLRLAS